MARGAPRCGKCGLHPKTREHREQCGIAIKKAPIKIRRGRLSEPAPASNALEAGWVLGATCLTCRTHYTSWEPEFQAEDSKHGKYGVFAQLPFTSKDYPICPFCLPWHWRTEARRWGMVDEVRTAYPETLVA